MRKQSLNDRTLEMLRKNGHQQALDEIARMARHQETRLIRPFVVGTIAQKTYNSSRDAVSRAREAIDTLSKPPYSIIRTDESYIFVTQETLRYASKS